MQTIRGQGPTPSALKSRKSGVHDKNKKIVTTRSQVMSFKSTARMCPAKW